jgi:hypothetical protein
MDHWESGPPSRDQFTTVANWKQNGEIHFQGERYYWSKDREFMKVIDLPSRISQPIELAMGVGDDVRQMLNSHGWQVVNAHDFTTDPWSYRDYVGSSRGEFSVAKDQNVRLRSGWFSERSACYLAAGRPVITQDTGFGTVLPTGDGLFAFNTTDDIVAAFEKIRADYPAQSRAARMIAEEHFKAETVMAKLLVDLGL